VEPVIGAERFHVQDMYWGSEGDEGSVSMEDYGSDYFDEMGSSSLSGGMSAGSQSWISGSDEGQSD